MKAQEIFNRLDEMKLSKAARNIIETSDQFGIIEMFGDCYTAEQVEEVVAEYYED